MSSSPSLVPQVSSSPSDKKKSSDNDPLRKTKKKKSGKGKKSPHNPVANLPANLTSKPGRPNDEGPSTIPGFNLAGRPDSLIKTDKGFKRHEVKSVGPYHTYTLPVTFTLPGTFTLSGTFPLPGTYTLHKII